MSSGGNKGCDFMASPVYNYHGQAWSDSGCEGTYMAPGWYQAGTYTLVASTYKNPSTGAAYTPTELATLVGGTTTSATTTTTPAATTTTPATTTFEQWMQQNYPNVVMAQSDLGGAKLEYEEWKKGQSTAVTTTPVALPSLANINVPAPAVTPAPAYEVSPEQQAWEEKVGGYLTSTLAEGGIGIPEETMALMTQKTTDTLKAKETEDIRVMRNNMERRGITNSGFVFSNEQKIRSGTTMAIANSITDLNIQNALMKMASFETAMGQAAQFLSYLGEMSQLKNQPAYQTWVAQQQANLYQYQAKIDIYKTQLQQAYQQQNLILQGQITSGLNAEQNAFELKITEMELEAQKQAAQATGAGQMVVGLLGLVAASF